MLLCDHYSNAFHLNCANLIDVPLGEWYCNNCNQEIRNKNLENSYDLYPFENQLLRDYLTDPRIINNVEPAQQEQLRVLGGIFELVDDKLCFRGNKGLKRVPAVGEKGLIIKQIH